MNLDRDFLARIAAETGFRGEMLEKVAHLLNLLRAIRENDWAARRSIRMRNLPAASGSYAMPRRVVVRAILRSISTICFACHYGR